MRTVTTIGSQRVRDSELGPQIDWRLLKRRLAGRCISFAKFCEDVHVWQPDFNRYVRGVGVEPSARTRLRVAFHVAVLGLNDDGKVVSEGRQPTTIAKVG